MRRKRKDGPSKRRINRWRRRHGYIAQPIARDEERKLYEASRIDRFGNCNMDGLKLNPPGEHKEAEEVKCTPDVLF